MDELWDKTLTALDRGDFTRLEELLGGPDSFDKQIAKWFEEGQFDEAPEALAEAFTCACMLGRTATASYLLEKSVDPYAGMKTGLAGFHYAVSGGRLDVVKMLVERKIPMNVENRYGGTVWGQALWSAVNEHKVTHAEIIEMLIDAGVEIEPGTLLWWETQNVPSAETKERVAKALRDAG
ncbi:MAG TPA: ankyrin repeat domain-containing protein [Pyrinomonadaceae bacterium]|nr:ankyrin repeat domain-containing protein [Pyrinomonadaceae bacterium]